MTSGAPLTESPDADRLAEDLLATALGDRDAFRRVFDATSPRVFGVAYRLVRDRVGAEDVVQDVFLDIWRRAGRFDPGRGPALRWIMVLAHARSVDHIRRSDSQRLRDAADAAKAVTTWVDAPGDQLLRDEQAAEIRSALTSLTDLQQQALQLTYWQGHTMASAGKLLGIPLPTFQARVRGAVMALRKAGVHQVLPR